MVITPMLQSGKNVDLTNNADTTVNDVGQFIVVSITDKKWWVEQEEVDGDTLIEQIYYEYEKSSDGETTRTILLKGDRSLEYRDVRVARCPHRARHLFSESRYGEGAVTWAQMGWKLVHRNQYDPIN